jgi:hypothetical protein
LATNAVLSLGHACTDHSLKGMHGITSGMRLKFAFSGFVIRERSALAVR